jgi:chorismate-pyruvate lyase
LPYEIISQIKRKDAGIGSIITAAELETFRKILRIGYNSRTKSIFRIYQIIYKGNVGFEISEVFPRFAKTSEQ